MSCSSDDLALVNAVCAYVLVAYFLCTPVLLFLLVLFLAFFWLDLSAAAPSHADKITRT